MRFLIAIPVLMVLLAPPAMAQTDFQARNRLQALEQEVRDLRSQLASGSAASASSGGSATGVELRLSDMQQQLRELNGRLETSEFQNRQLQSQLTKMSDDYESRLQKLELSGPSMRPSAAINTPEEDPISAATAALPPTPQTTPPASDVNLRTNVASEGSAIKGDLGNIALRDGTVVDAKVEPKQPALPDKPADYGLTASEHYDYAFGLLREAEYDKAQTAFESFLTKYPKDRLTPNAKYWLGETLYVRENYDQAAVVFAESFEVAPKGSKAPDSLLKLAMSLAKLERKADACATLKALSGQFPNASPAIRANAEQTGKELKCAPAPTPKKAVKKPAPLAKKPAEEPKTEKPEGEE